MGGGGMGGGDFDDFFEIKTKEENTESWMKS